MLKTEHIFALVEDRERLVPLQPYLAGLDIADGTFLTVGLEVPVQKQHMPEVPALYALAYCNTVYIPTYA